MPKRFTLTGGADDFDVGVFRRTNRRAVRDLHEKAGPRPRARWVGLVLAWSCIAIAVGALGWGVGTGLLALAVFVATFVGLLMILQRWNIGRHAQAIGRWLAGPGERWEAILDETGITVVGTGMRQTVSWSIVNVVEDGGPGLGLAAGMFVLALSERMLGEDAAEIRATVPDWWRALAPDAAVFR